MSGAQFVGTKTINRKMQIMSRNFREFATFEYSKRKELND